MKDSPISDAIGRVLCQSSIGLFRQDIFRKINAVNPVCDDIQLVSTRLSDMKKAGIIDRDTKRTPTGFRWHVTTYGRTYFNAEQQSDETNEEPAAVYTAETAPSADATEQSNALPDTIRDELKKLEALMEQPNRPRIENKDQKIACLSRLAEILDKSISAVLHEIIADLELN